MYKMLHFHKGITSYIYSKTDKQTARFLDDFRGCRGFTSSTTAADKYFAFTVHRFQYDIYSHAIKLSVCCCWRDITDDLQQSSVFACYCKCGISIIKSFMLSIQRFLTQIIRSKLGFSWFTLYLTFQLKKLVLLTTR